MLRDGGSLPDGSTRPDGSTSSLPPAVTNADGVLTPFPHIRFTITPSEFEIVTANFEVVHDDDERGPLLQMYLEIRNVGSAIESGFVPDVSLDFDEVITTVDAEPYYQQIGTGALFTTTSSCIPPGGIGVFYGVQRGLDEDDLASAASLVVDARPLRLSSTTYHRPTDAPTITSSIGPGTEGWTVSGELTPVRLIYNAAFRSYARDERGVLFDRAFAYPNELGDIPAGVTVPFESYPARREFHTTRAFASWINR